MAVRVLTDFHHSSLLRATNMLFGDRLGMEVFRPIGMEWFEEGFWAINDQRDTAEQFLKLESQPLDSTPPLNDSPWHGYAPGIEIVYDPGNSSRHKACTLGFFMNNQFDYVIASIPAHVPLFERLIAEFQPQAKLIVQIGNEWPAHLFRSHHNILASISPRPLPGKVMFYHQEFDTSIFKPTAAQVTRKVYSFVNILQNTGQGWEDFQQLEALLHDYEFRSYGGQCRDGNMNGPHEMAEAMQAAQFIFHSKPGGDGFGHVIHSAYASGRPVIGRSSQYKGQLAERLFVEGTFIDLDKHSYREAMNIIRSITASPDYLLELGKRAGDRFREVVNYEEEAEEIGKWLTTL